MGPNVKPPNCQAGDVYGCTALKLNRNFCGDRPSPIIAESAGGLPQDFARPNCRQRRQGCPFAKNVSLETRAKKKRYVVGGEMEAFHLVYTKTRRGIWSQIMGIWAS